MFGLGFCGIILIMSRRVNVRGVVWKDGKIFAVRHKDLDGDGVVDYWATSGGGLDDGESLEDGVRRGFMEELGVGVKVGRLLFIQQYDSVNDGHMEFSEKIEFFFLIDNPEDFEDIDLRRTSHGALEIGEWGFVDPREVKVLPAFLGEVDVGEVIRSGGGRIFNYLGKG